MPTPNTKLTVQRNCYRLKKIFTYSFFATLSFLTLLTIGYFTPVKSLYSTQKNCSFTICVSNDGMHTNIWLPVKNQAVDWGKYLSLEHLERDAVGNYKYLSFGWGDRAFYIQTPTLADLKLSTTFKALFLPTPSTILVQGRQSIPNNIKIKCVQISKNEYLKLTQFIKNTFKLDPQGKQIRIADGHSPNSGFYEAKGSYSILRTCNNWTAEALKTANVDTPLWAGLSSAIVLHLRSSCQSNH